MNNNILIGAIVVILAGGAVLMIFAKTAREERTPTENGKVMMPVNSGENAAPGSVVHDLPVAPAAAAAREDLAAKIGVAKERIVIMLVEEHEWPDGCLGLGGPSESCLAAIVPGFRVELEAGGTTHVYRTDKIGTTLRYEGSHVR